MRLWKLTLVLLFVVVAGCSSVQVVMTGTKREPTEIDKVAVYPSIPSNAAGVAFLRAKSAFHTQGAIDDCLKMIKKSAADLGANGIHISKVDQPVLFINGLPIMDTYVNAEAFHVVTGVADGAGTMRYIVDPLKEDFEETADLYRKDKGIDKATWDRMAEWFLAQLNTTPFLAEEFNKTYAKGGNISAIRFIHEYAAKNMENRIDPPSFSSNATVVTTINTTPQTPPVLGPVTPDAYGPGVGMDATGRPVTYK